MRVTPILRPEVLLHPPYPFVTSRVVSTALVTCYVSTCCNNNTLVSISQRVSKFRFLGCIFGGAVLCIYYANEFSILPPFRFISSTFVAYLFLFDSLVNVPRYHVAPLIALADLQTYHVVKLPRYLCFVCRPAVLC